MQVRAVKNLIRSKYYLLDAVQVSLQKTRKNYTLEREFLQLTKAVHVNCLDPIVAFLINGINYP